MSPIVEGEYLHWHPTSGGTFYFKVACLDQRYVYLIASGDATVNYRYDLLRAQLRHFIGDSWALMPEGYIVKPEDECDDLC